MEQPCGACPVGRCNAHRSSHCQYLSQDGYRELWQLAFGHLPLGQVSCLLRSCDGLGYVWAPHHPAQYRPLDLLWQSSDTQWAWRVSQRSGGQGAHGGARDDSKSPIWVFLERKAPFPRKKNPYYRRTYLRNDRPRALYRQFFFRQDGSSFGECRRQYGCRSYLGLRPYPSAWDRSSCKGGLSSECCSDVWGYHYCLYPYRYRYIGGGCGWL